MRIGHNASREEEYLAAERAVVELHTLSRENSTDFSYKRCLTSEDVFG